MNDIIRLNTRLCCTSPSGCVITQFVPWYCNVHYFNSLKVLRCRFWSVSNQTNCITYPVKFLTSAVVLRSMTPVEMVRGVFDDHLQPLFVKEPQNPQCSSQRKLPAWTDLLCYLRVSKVFSMRRTSRHQTAWKTANVFIRWTHDLLTVVSCPIPLMAFPSRISQLYHARIRNQSTHVPSNSTMKLLKTVLF